MYNILFFILVVLIVTYSVKYIIYRWKPVVRTSVTDVVLIDRFRADKQNNVVETITREQYAHKEPPENLERAMTMTHYHINGRSLDLKHKL